MRPTDRGIALVAAVFVLVVVAALAAALCFAALQEFRIGRNSVQVEQAFNAAEAGLGGTLARWNVARLNRLGTNDTAGFSAPLTGGTGAYSGVVQRLNSQLFFIRSTGQDRTASARRTLAVLARLAPLRLPVTAALAVGGQVAVGPAGLVDGADRNPEGWGCPEPRDSLAGVLIGDVRRLLLAGCAAGACVRGSPAVREDTTIAGSAVPVLGEAGWSSLAGRADTLLPGNPAPRLTPGAMTLVYAPGDLELSGGLAQGVFLVQGNLVVEGGAHVVGLVVVRGVVTMKGAGGDITGAVLAGGAEVGTAAGQGQAVVAYSGCAVRQALAAAGSARPLSHYAWAELF